MLNIGRGSICYRTKVFHWLPDEPIGERRQRAKRPESTLIVPSLELENGRQIDADGQTAKRTRRVRPPPSESDVEANATQFAVDELKSQNRWQLLAARIELKQ